jgi:putative intracellular protease/amidase
VSKTHVANPSCMTRTLLAGAMAAVAAFNVSIAAADAAPLPVLMVIANQDFYYKEYADTRAALQARGLAVVVAAGKTTMARPQGTMVGMDVRPAIALSQADASDYSAIVFVGGWGASSYQYAFGGTYANAAYNGQTSVARDANVLINDFVAQDKYVAALSHGVTVLAWARVDGASPLRGRAVVATAGGVPGFRSGNFDFRDAEYPARWQIEGNGGVMLTSGSIGDPMTSADDVIVDGRIITAENPASAVRFADEIARAVTHRN